MYFSYTNASSAYGAIGFPGERAKKCIVVGYLDPVIINKNKYHII